jgi:hypothetical protein
MKTEERLTKWLTAPNSQMAFQIIIPELGLCRCVFDMEDDKGKYKGKKAHRNWTLCRQDHSNPNFAHYLQCNDCNYQWAKQYWKHDHLADFYGMAENVFSFLVALRDSNVTNMYGASPYLQNKFGFARATAENYLKAWMDSHKTEELI